jgi:hypothetical protein
MRQSEIALCNKTLDVQSGKFKFKLRPLVFISWFTGTPTLILGEKLKKNNFFVHFNLYF